ncbi:hypothetical protein [Brevibacillus gelatini]
MGAKQFAKEGVEPLRQMAAALEGPPVDDDFVELVMAWGDKAVTYADAHKKDYDEAVDTIVPAASGYPTGTVNGSRPSGF